MRQFNQDFKITGIIYLMDRNASCARESEMFVDETVIAGTWKQARGKHSKRKNLFSIDIVYSDYTMFDLKDVGSNLKP